MNYVWSFLSHSPKQVASIYRDTRVLRLAKKNKGVSSNHYKHELYSLFANMEARNKKTGFESFEDLDSRVRAKLEKLQSSKKEMSASNAVDVEVNDYIQESISAAREIYRAAKMKNKKVVLCLSGGLDSELMVRIFSLAGVPFETYTARYNNSANSYDLAFAEKLVDELQLNHRVEEFDVVSYFTSDEMLEDSVALQIDSPQILAYHKIAEHLAKQNVLPVFAGEIRFEYDGDKVAAVQNYKQGGCPEGYINTTGAPLTDCECVDSLQCLPGEVIIEP